MNSVHKLCIVCFQIGDLDLFSPHEESKNILLILRESLCITLVCDRHKPCAICQECKEELNRAVAFRRKCLSIDERFRNYSLELSNIAENSCKDESKNNQPLRYDCVFSNENNFDEFCDDSISITVNRSEIDSNFKCDECNKILKTKKSLLKHYVAMHEKRKHIGKVSGFGTARRYHCTSCAYSTPHSQTLVNHMRRHNGEKPYHCHCGKSFTQSSSLAAHLKTHSPTTYFTCISCGKQFKHAFAMKNHLKVHESGSFSCSVCFKLLKTKRSLQAHMRRHFNICNYNCEVCGDTFVTSSELVNHRKKHSIEKKVECHLCGYKTHTKKNLIIHLKRHTGNRSFKCSMCHVQFYTKSNLQRHQRVHTRDKPFSCPTCNQKFSYSPSLNKHMKVVHGVDYKWADFKWKQSKVVKLTVKS